MSKRIIALGVIVLVVCGIGIWAAWWTGPSYTQSSPSDIGVTSGHLQAIGLIAYFGILIVLRLAAIAVRAWGGI